MPSPPSDVTLPEMYTVPQLVKAGVVCPRGGISQLTSISYEMSPRILRHTHHPVQQRPVGAFSLSKAMRRYGSRATADTEDGWMCDADEEHHLLD
jgi:hypothetical protein